ncbi:MAG: WD40/YVTN/BNR-like repeat-containing protein [Stackebrandtia sp.]
MRKLQRFVVPATVLSIASIALVGMSGSSQAEPAAESMPLAWKLTDTGVDNQFRGLSPVDSRIAWAAGAGGVVLRTDDGGGSWQDVSPADAEGLEFRDIEAFDAKRAVALTIGEGEDSRVFVTEDGGATWHNSFVNEEAEAFYDCMAFFDEQHGIAMSDPVDGRIRFILTDDGGHSWQILPHEQSPEAVEGEFGFAASGQCLVAADANNAFQVTGGGAARLLHTPDRGQTWTAYDTPMAAGESAGIYAADFRDARHGILVGGDYTTPDSAVDALAYTTRGPAETTLSKRPSGHYRSGVSFLAGPIAIAVGPTGSDVTLDGGRTWRGFDDGPFDAVECTSGFSCWASGPDGRIAVLAVG